MVSGVRRMNEVNARRARLVPGRVTVFWRLYHLGIIIIIIIKGIYIAQVRKGHKCGM